MRQRRLKEESERQRLIAIGNEKDAQLQHQLRQLEQEELEEIRKLKL